jgi:hypothetical protein
VLGCPKRFRAGGRMCRLLRRSRSGWHVSLGDDGKTLLTSAWLHDVGYAPELALSGFHPLDGARFLREEGAPARVVNLVAFHSAAATEADELGLSAELAEFDDERSLTRDLLWYADMTTGPDGQRMEFAARMAEVRQRYDSDHYVNRALEVGLDEREAAVACSLVDRGRGPGRSGVVRRAVRVAVVDA